MKYVTNGRTGEGVVGTFIIRVTPQWNQTSNVEQGQSRITFHESFAYRRPRVFLIGWTIKWKVKYLIHLLICNIFKEILVAWSVHTISENAYYALPGGSRRSLHGETIRSEILSVCVKAQVRARPWPTAHPPPDVTRDKRSFTSSASTSEVFEAS